jgi:hypothetical protein
MRDYSVIDIDSILRRKEHTKGWKFPEFAKDVLNKRLEAAEFKHTSNMMEILFGRSMEPAERAHKYVGTSKNQIKAENFWAPEWITYLNFLWDNNKPLEAKLGEAWLRQGQQIRRRVAQDPTQAQGTPWRRTQWWAKERNEIALMQIAGERQQALIWSGERQIIDLAGYNILAFMTICKTIWATWQRRNPEAADNRNELPQFSVEDQAIGISEASQIWFNKIQVGLEADHRARFINTLGEWFRRRMLSDKALSYPGHSGFSLLAADMSLNRKIVSIIKVCRDHGDLMESPHTTKNQSQESRIKWYLHPLLCPLFRIPHIRTKEPIYTNLTELEQLYSTYRRKDPVADGLASPSERLQLDLPGI